MANDSAFVAREEELKRLRRFYGQALNGEATVCLVSGEPGAGKTALVEHFAAKLQDQDPDVVVLRGDCDAQTGAGDPYLPFREILTQLTGDIDEEVERGRMSTENASRLRRLADVTAEVVIEHGPDLIDLFIPGGSLVARLGARVAADLPGATETGTAAGEGEPGTAVSRSLDQERIFE